MIIMINLSSLKKSGIVQMLWSFYSIIERTVKLINATFS